MAFVNKGKSRSPLPLSLWEFLSKPISHSLQNKKNKKKEKERHQGSQVMSTFFTPGKSDFEKLYFVKFILKMTLYTTSFFLL